MSKPAVLVLALILLLSIASAARREPGFEPALSAQKTQAVGEAGEVVVDEVCEEGLAEEECLARRTLLAHTDYIYTNKHGKP